MPAKKLKLPAKELEAARQYQAEMAQASLLRNHLKSLSTNVSIIAQSQERTEAMLREILSQMKKTNKTLTAILSATAPDEVGGVH
jgi:hypothetical protein